MSASGADGKEKGLLMSFPAAAAVIAVSRGWLSIPVIMKNEKQAWLADEYVGNYPES